MNFATFRITAGTVIRQARDFFEEDWQGACSYLQGVLGCDFASVVQFFTTHTLVDGTETGEMLPVPDPEVSTFDAEMREHYHSRINHHGRYLRPCAEVLSLGPFWMAKTLGIELGYPDWDEEPHPCFLENGSNPNPVRGTATEHYVLKDEVLFRIDGRSLIFEPCEPPPPWMVCESPKAALTAWEAAHEWLEQRGWVQEVRNQMPQDAPSNRPVIVTPPVTLPRENASPQGIVRRVYSGVTKEMVEEAYKAHKACIQSDWRKSWSEWTKRHRHQMVKDLTRMLTACKQFAPADWYSMVSSTMAKASHNLQFDGGEQIEDLISVECGVIQTCHEFMAEAAQTLGILDEMRQLYEVRD